jgi:hypothetical protein
LTADKGSKLSLTSTSAQACCARVNSANVENNNEVLPDDGGPHISVSAPHGNPPASASTEAIPVETIAGTTRSGNSDAGTIREARFPRLLRIARKRSAGASASIERGAEKEVARDDTGHLRTGNYVARGARSEAANEVRRRFSEPVRFSLFIRLRDGILRLRRWVVKTRKKP